MIYFYSDFQTLWNAELSNFLEAQKSSSEMESPFEGRSGRSTCPLSPREIGYIFGLL